MRSIFLRARRKRLRTELNAHTQRKKEEKMHRGDQATHYRLGLRAAGDYG
jgi:hypothetical protein